MLNPNTKNFGILGMRKFAKEFPSWEHFLNEKNYKMALEWMAMFSNTPPTLAEEINNFTAKRKELSNTIKELAELTPYQSKFYLVFPRLFFSQEREEVEG
jgi:hypothetical protein